MSLLLWVVVTGIAVTAGYNFFKDLGGSLKSAKFYEDLRDTTNYPEISDRVISLQASNPELFGWIKIDGTRIDYPVMHTPGEPEFYLHRDYNGEPSDWGTPFLDANCFDGCQNLIIYGHHMQDGSMFSALTKYESEDFSDTFSKIQLNIGGVENTYTVWAVCLTDIHDPGFAYYTFTDLRDRERKKTYLDLIRTHALYTRNVEPEDRELLTLSTCNYHTKDGRLVVIALKD